jgi:hypothetical protein
MLLGNMYLVTGVVNNDPSNLELAVKRYSSAGSADVWANFGRAQCYDVMGTLNELKLRDEIAKDAITRMVEEYNARQEPRSKLLRKTTEYICHMWLNDSSEVQSGVWYALEKEASDVDQELTVYSQIRKKNIRKVEFLREMGELRNCRDMKKTMQKMAILV